MTITYSSSTYVRCIGSDLFVIQTYKFCSFQFSQLINIHSPFLCVWVRAKLDDNARLLDFTQKLEAACVGAVESGKMTKDLALLVHGSSKYVAAVFVLLPHSSGIHLVILY